MLEAMPEDDKQPSLEGPVAALEREVRQLRAALGRTRATAESPFTPAARPEARPVAAPAAAPRPPVAPRLDLETLIGRYGMLGLATLLALAAIGTFVSWAVAHGLLGPTPRVALGLIAAAGIGAAGLKLRPRS